MIANVRSIFPPEFKIYCVKYHLNCWIVKFFGPKSAVGAVKCTTYESFMLTLLALFNSTAYYAFYYN
ncbi:MAG: hypothetical protein A2079_02615 [Geobacteraceae bacterium GWC2_48_7]|nr:MAG: hypothetical protein A2079_02615 [Geobacteraceae bacterium GWC2_48_7]